MAEADQFGYDRVQAVQAGVASSAAQVAEITRGRYDGGPADTTRFIDMNPSGGLHLRVLTDRGFDIGSAWFRGDQIAWLSKVGPAAPLDLVTDLRHRDRFSGGLVTTCGLDNVGAPSEGIGLHGTIGQVKADNVTTECVMNGSEWDLVARATVDDVTSLARHLRLERTITTGTGRARVTVSDAVTNLGTATEPAPILYHVNIGYPVWQPGAVLEIASREARARDDVTPGSVPSDWWASAPEPGADAVEIVHEHLGLATGAAVVLNRTVGLRVEVSWDVRQLHRLYQWTHPATRVYALGIEPSNASALGIADDRAAGTLPVIEPGQTRTTGVTISVDETG